MAESLADPGCDAGSNAGVGGSLVACVDFGSTFTKAALVDVDAGRLVDTASHRTTSDTDVLDGWAACLAELVGRTPEAAVAPVLACSSAGGGLRIAVVGNEELVTAEAGRRVALSSGGRVVHVASGGLEGAGLRDLEASAPDVVLLVGGTDGGNAEVLLSCAAALSDAQWPGPVVVAGNIEAREEVAGLLDAGGTPHVLSQNLVPQIGVLRPGPARAAIREMFLRHVIGGKHLSARSDFTAMVRGATPDVVLTAVELLAEQVGDVAVVDVGGATTDVYSVVEVDPEDAGLSRHVVARSTAVRTVQGDLGMRWSAESTVEEGLAAGLLDRAEEVALRAAAAARREQPGLLPTDPTGRRVDELLAAAAAGVALRRHAGRAQVVFGPDGRVVERSGTDLREVDLLVGSGGVLRSTDGQVARRILATAVAEGAAGGWQLPRATQSVVDRDYVLAASGLLAEPHPHAARALLAGLTPGMSAAAPNLGP